MDLKEASFFRIIIKDSDDFISLPSTFTKKYMERSNETQTIILKTNSSTTKWDVKYLKIDDKYYFMDGWLKFMKSNGVQIGDFLIFWLVSRSPIVFNIFPYAPNACLKNQSSCSSHNINPETQKSGAGGDEKGTPIEEVSPDDDVSVKNINKSMSKIIGKTYCYYIPLTKVFETATGISDRYDTLLLKNKDGKKWKVDLRRYKQKHQSLCITKGWAKFMKDNNVEIGDKCKFKHLKGKLIRVYVIKKKISK